MTRELSARGSEARGGGSQVCRDLQHGVGARELEDLGHAGIHVCQAELGAGLFGFAGGGQDDPQASAIDIVQPGAIEHEFAFALGNQAGEGRLEFTGFAPQRQAANRRQNGDAWFNFRVGDLHGELAQRIQQAEDPAQAEVTVYSSVMSDWKFAHDDDAPVQLAKLHHFSMVKKEASGGEVEFTITIKEFAKPDTLAMSFFAQADKQTNQRTLPVTPAGWGDSLLTALSACIAEINRFPYQG